MRNMSGRTGVVPAAAFGPPLPYVQGVSFWQGGSENSWEATLEN